MFLIREASRDDIDHVLAVAKYLDTVNLPADRERIDAILDLSERSFRGSIERESREYLFVMVDTATSQIVGTSMIHAQHGTRRAPHVFLQVLKEERYSTTLDRYMVHEYLKLNFNYDGPTEIGGLSLLPSHRGRPESLGKLLSYVRFLFIAMHRELFRDEILSELMPPLEADGTSKLWKHFGRLFTGLTYREADHLSKENKEFIWALFPHNEIYTSLFPEDVSDVIGKVGPETKPVEKMLRRIGFDYAGQIDPFDVGPHFRARTDDVALVRGSARATVAAANTEPSTAPMTIVAAEPGQRFRAVQVRAPAGDTVALTADARSALGVSVGDSVWKVSF